MSGTTTRRIARRSDAIDSGRRRNRVRSLAPLSALVHLEELHVQSNQLASLDGLAHCSRLEVLDVSDNALGSLAPLANHPRLRALYASGNRLDDLGPLSGLATLWYLSLSANALTDLSPLAHCPALAVVECFGHPNLTGLLSLAGLPRLKRVASHGSFGDEELARFSALRPDVALDRARSNAGPLE